MESLSLTVSVMEIKELLIDISKLSRISPHGNCLTFYWACQLSALSSASLAASGIGRRA